MRIGLDARYVYDHFPGIGRYTANLARALGMLNTDHTIVVLTNPALPNTRHNLAELQTWPSLELVSTPIRPFSVAEQVQLPRLARRLKLDLFHSPYYIKPYVGMPCPSLVTIYDLIARRYPQILSRRARFMFRLTTWLAIHTATRIITVSHSARDDITTYYRLPTERIAVTHLAADEHFCPQPPAAVKAVQERYQLPSRYVLYVGANKPHKNLARLVQAWEQVVTADTDEQTNERKLIIAGHHDPRYPMAQHLVAERDLNSSVLFIPNISEADLPAFYSGAEVFVFPSYYEGFGLPPLEAMACGAPVLCANTSSLPEVVGDAALTVDPFQVDAIAAGLRRLVRDATLRSQLSTRGLQRARQLSWQQTARSTLQVYVDVASDAEGWKVAD